VIRQRPGPLGPDATIGILGGGQLGRMLALAAARLGFKSHVFCPDSHSPAFDVVPQRDGGRLSRFRGTRSVLRRMSMSSPMSSRTCRPRPRRSFARKPVLPDPKVLAITQGPLTEKSS
jgi:5-(carboxyamino)imidazole ribonucleotide synthase